MKNLIKLLLMLTVATITSCTSTSVEENVFPEFSLSDDAINKAKKTFRRSDNNYLCLLMVDRQGNVVKVKKLASKLENPRHDMKVTKEMYSVKYKPAKAGDSVYREYIFPYKVNVSGSHGKVKSSRQHH